jgi:Spy/CpxP family protein refolding chaperone
MNRRALGLVLAVFVLGVALGGGLTYAFGNHIWGVRAGTQSAQSRRARTVEQFTRELNLTAEQQKQLDAVFVEMQAKYEAIHKQIAPQTDQVRQDGREQIRAILTPEQKPKYEEMLRRLDEERKKRSFR